MFLKYIKTYSRKAKVKLNKYKYVIANQNSNEYIPLTKT
jgi:hypothetical protein